MPQTSASVIKEMYNEMKSAAEAQRKTNIEERRNYLEDDFKHLIIAELKKQFVKETYESINLLVDDSLNIVSFMSEEIGGGVYQYEAMRAFKSPNAQDEDQRYKDILKETQIDIIMDEVAKATFALNEYVVGIIPRGNRICIDIMPPDYVTVWQKQDDPLAIRALMYEVILSDSQTNAAINTGSTATQYKRNFIYWDIDGNHFKFDEHFRIIPNPQNPENVNPYKDKDGNFIIPFVICHKKYNARTIWDGASGNKMFSAQRQLGVLSTLFNYYAKVLSLKQLSITGNADIKAGNDQLLDPLHVFKVEGEGASVSVLDMQGRLDMFEKNVIVGKLERALNSEGLSLESFTRTGAAESGYKLKIKKEGQLKRISALKKYFRVYEKQIAEILRIVNNTTFPEKKIADDAEFSIDFGDYVPEENPIDTDKHREWELAHDQKTEVDFLMEDNPDLDEDAAKKKLEENRTFNSSNRGNTNAVQKAVTGAIDDINGNGIPDDQEA